MDAGHSSIFGPLPPAVGSEKMTPHMRQAHNAAREFEQVFLSSMLSQMFSGLGEEGPLGGGEENGNWRQFLTEAYAREIVASGGIGLSDQIQRELLSLQEDA